uniref:Inhibitor of growth protein 3 n=1 Tax=Timema douglasi TaxID=61478 RepID=A0A7R8ZDE4_TIMDO|nr:unnamed protein product [Timema douglasi]
MVTISTPTYHGNYLQTSVPEHTVSVPGLSPEKRRDSNSSVTSLEKRLAVEKPLPAPVVEPRPLSAGSGPIQPPSSSSCAIAPPIPTSNMSYTLGHIGAGGTAIAAAASQAIAATQQMQQGRRTASLKASYEAINIGVHAHEFSIGKELAGAAQTALATIQESSKKQKKKSTNSSVTVVPGSVTSAGGSVSVVTPLPTIVPAPPSPLPPPQPQVPVEPPPVVATDPVVPTPANDPTSVEWTEDDPNDPRYCICNQVSYGDMVACDNEDCPYEWFHYPCVGILAPPKGKWFCPQCTSSMKRRGSRKNYPRVQEELVPGVTSPMKPEGPGRTSARWNIPHEAPRVQEELAPGIQKSTDGVPGCPKAVLLLMHAQYFSKLLHNSLSPNIVSSSLLLEFNRQMGELRVLVFSFVQDDNLALLPNVGTVP